MSDPWLDRLPAPPRPVPWRLSLCLRLGGLSVIGWVFTPFSLVFLAVVVGVGDFGQALRISAAELAAAPGVMLRWAEGNAEINEETVIENYAEFQVAGVAHECKSYAAGVGLAPGEPVMVEYDAADPAVCRIVGMSASAMPWWILLFLLPFLAVGVGFAWSGWRRGGRTVRLLRYGRTAYGALVDRTDTGVRINDEIQWKVTFAYTDHHGQPQTFTCRTVDLEDVEDDAHEGLLYDPDDPAHGVAVDALPDLVDNDHTGRWRSVGLGRTALLLIGPAVTALMLLIIAAVA